MEIYFELIKLYAESCSKLIDNFCKDITSNQNEFK